MASFISEVLASSWVFAGFSVAALVATIVVAVGLYLEREEYQDRKMRIGAAMVRGGVVLEALFGLVAFTSATIRESRSEKEIASLTERAGQLEKDSTSARAAIAASNERAASAERDAALANARAETARLETARIEKEYGPRQLSPPQLASLAEKAKAFSGMTFTFAVHTNDTESANFGVQIGSALRAVGWTVNPNIFESFTIQTGLQLITGNDANSIRAAQMLKDELGPAGFPIADAGSVQVAKHIELTINPRPLPLFSAFPNPWRSEP